MKVGIQSRPPQSGMHRAASIASCECGEQYTRREWRALLTVRAGKDGSETAHCRACGCVVTLARAVEAQFDDVEDALDRATAKLEECSQFRRDQEKHWEAIGAAKLAVLQARELRRKAG